MSLSTAEIKAVVENIRPTVEGAQIGRIDQPDEEILIFELQKGTSKSWLQIVADPRFTRLHLLTRRPGQGKPAGGFCNVVRQHLTGSPVRSLHQVENDRIVILQSVEHDVLMKPQPVRLVAELIGGSSNLILVDDSDVILGSLFTREYSHRTIAQGKKYVQPPPPPPSTAEQASENRFQDATDSDDPLALSRAIQSEYGELENEAEIAEKQEALRGKVDAQLEHLTSLQENLREDKRKAERANELRRKGELLKIQLPKLKRGESTVTVKDIFEPEVPEKTIELDPALTPEQNIQKYFEKYKKRKASQEHIEERMQETKKQIRQLKLLRQEIEAADDRERIAQIEKQLRKENLLRPEPKPPSHRREEKKQPRRFVSADGWEILVARNQKQSHRLTFNIARGNDYWMHLLRWPGPHVIIRKPKGKDVSLDALLDAAHLAVYYSKIRGTKHAKIVYTQRKYVRSTKGSDPGKVHYAEESTLDLHFSTERMERILNRREIVPG
ncbi:MAG: NFACT family protein [Candidatus Brocadiia bacterium]